MSRDLTRIEEEPMDYLNVEQEDSMLKNFHWAFYSCGIACVQGEWTSIFTESQEDQKRIT